MFDFNILTDILISQNIYKDIYLLIFEYIPEYQIYPSTEKWVKNKSALSVVISKNIELDDSRYKSCSYSHSNRNYFYYNCIIKSIKDPYNIELIILNRHMDGKDSPGILNVNITDDIYIFPDIRDDYNYNYCKWLIKTNQIYYVNHRNMYNILEHIISDENLMKKIQYNIKKFPDYIQKCIVWYIYVYDKSLIKKYDFHHDHVFFQFEKYNCWNSSTIFHIAKKTRIKASLIKDIQENVFTRSWSKKGDLWHVNFKITGTAYYVVAVPIKELIGSFGRPNVDP